MLIYHGSICVVEKPEIRESEGFLDFGTGFYATTSYEQAERWAKIKMNRVNADTGYVSVYDFDCDSAKEKCGIVTFGKADKKWLDFVVKNRRGEKIPINADIHIGPVADDNVYKTIRLFEVGVFNSRETVRRLKTEILHDQITFHSETALEFLKFTEAKTITAEKNNECR